MLILLPLAGLIISSLGLGFSIMNENVIWAVANTALICYNLFMVYLEGIKGKKV